MAARDAFRVIHWAADDAPTILRKNGRIDLEAHKVLDALAVWADAEDATCHPSPPQIANRARLGLRATSEAMRRLVVAGLIVAVADLNGTTVWQLQTQLIRNDAELVAAAVRQVTARQKTNERQQRKRARARRHNAGEHDDCLPRTCVVAAERHAVGERDKAVDDMGVSRRQTASRHAVGERDVTPSPPLHPQVTPGVTAIELPTNCQIDRLGNATHHPRATETEPEIDHGGGELTPVPATKRIRTKPAPVRNRGRQLPLVAAVTPEPDEDQDDTMRPHLRELLDRPTHRPPAPITTGPACPRCEVLLDPDQTCRNTTCQPATPTAPAPAVDECGTCGVLLDPDRICRNPTHASTG